VWRHRVLVTRPWHQLEAPSEQHKTSCRRLKAKKVIFRTVLLGVGGSIYISAKSFENTLRAPSWFKTILKSSALIHEGSTSLPLNYIMMFTPYIVLTNWLLQARARKNELLSRSWSGAGGYQLPSRSPLLIFSIGGDSRHFGPMCLLFLHWCREHLAACVLFFKCACMHVATKVAKNNVL